MVSTGQIPGVFGDPTGLGMSAVKRGLASHRAFGQVPSSGKGGGVAAVHFQPIHYAALLLGFGGAQPSEAGEAAATFLSFVWHMTSKPGDPYFRAGEATVPGNLGEVLTSLVLGGWKTPEPATRAYNYPDLLLSPHHPKVEILWRRDDGHLDFAEIYGPPHGVPYTPKGGDVQRQSFVKHTLIRLASELWRSTPQKGNTEGLPGPSVPTP